MAIHGVGSELISDGVTETSRLLTLVSSGDRGAFSKLYDHLAPRVHGMVRRTLLDDSQSQEVTQDVFFEVWRTARRFDSTKGSGVGWIMTMAHGRAVDRVRSAKTSRARDVRVGLRDTEVHFDPVAEAGEVSAESARVTAAMRRLTEIQRDAITMTYFEGLNGPERLGIPIGTVKSRIREALIRLRDELGVGLPEDESLAS
jgi:RNA polymerase sigma-70 factor (ECF subfamily)